MTDPTQKPAGCPCCGGTMEDEGELYSHPENKMCPLFPIILWKNEPETISAWNRRVADEALARRAAEIAAGLMWHECRHGEMSSNCTTPAIQAVEQAKSELAKEANDGTH